jgi:glycolate oxidase
VKQEVFREGARFGGVVTAEHGIGKTRLPQLDMMLDDKSKELMQGIKQLFDPNNILNPGCAIV